MPPPSPDKEMKKLDFNWNPEFKQIDRSMPRLCAIRDVDVPPPAVDVPTSSAATSSSAAAATPSKAKSVASARIPVKKAKDALTSSASSSSAAAASKKSSNAARKVQSAGSSKSALSNGHVKDDKETASTSRAAAAASSSRAAPNKEKAKGARVARSSTLDNDETEEDEDAVSTTPRTTVASAASRAAAKPEKSKNGRTAPRPSDLKEEDDEDDEAPSTSRAKATQAKAKDAEPKGDVMKEKMKLTRNFDEANLTSARFAHTDVIKTIPGNDFDMAYYHKTGMAELLLFTDLPRGLKVPPKDFTPRHVMNLIGKNKSFSYLDKKTQGAVPTYMEEFVDYYENVKGRDESRNVISLEVSNTGMQDLVHPPSLVREVDMVQVWPDERKQRWASFYVENKKKVFTFVNQYTCVEHFVLMSASSSYTSFHIDAHGSAVWYHVVRGKKIFFVIPPTEENLVKYEDHLNNSEDKRFFGSIVDKCTRVEVEAGQTLLLPAGWIHAVFTPCDSLVVGGNFLHPRAITMQQRVMKQEMALKVSKEEKYPYADEVTFYYVDHLVKKLSGRRHIRPSSKNLQHLEYQYVGKDFHAQGRHRTLPLEQHYKKGGDAFKKYKETEEYTHTKAVMARYKKEEKDQKKLDDFVAEEDPMICFHPSTYKIDLKRDAQNKEIRNASRLTLSSVYSQEFAIDEDLLRTTINPAMIIELENLISGLLKKDRIDFPEGLTRPNSLLFSLYRILEKRREQAKKDGIALPPPSAYLTKRWPSTKTLAMTTAMTSSTSSTPKTATVKKEADIKKEEILQAQARTPRTPARRRPNGVVKEEEDETVIMSTPLPKRTPKKVVKVLPGEQNGQSHSSKRGAAQTRTPAKKSKEIKKELKEEKEEEKTGFRVVPQSVKKRQSSAESTIIQFSDIDEEKEDEPESDTIEMLPAKIPTKTPTKKAELSNGHTRPMKTPSKRKPVSIEWQDDVEADPDFEVSPTKPKKAKETKKKDETVRVNAVLSLPVSTLLSNAEQEMIRVTRPEPDSLQELVGQAFLFPWVSDLLPFADVVLHPTRNRWNPQPTSIRHRIMHTHPAVNNGMLRKLPPFAFFNINGDENVVGESIRNEHEANFALALISKLRLYCDVANEHIAVVCVYEEQARHVHSLDSTLNVFTLDSYQGKDFAVVVLLTSKASMVEAAGMDALKRVVKPGASLACGSRERPPAAMPTARSAFYVCGKVMTLWSVPLWREVIRHALRPNDAGISAFIQEQDALTHYSILAPRWC